MAATLLATRIATWRAAESKLRSARLTGTGSETVAARATVERQLDGLARELDLSGHASVAVDLAREAVLMPMVRARRAAGVACSELSGDLSRVRARIRAAR